MGYLIRTGDLWLFTLSPLSHDIKDVMVEINIESRGRAHRAQALRLGIYLFIYVQLQQIYYQPIGKFLPTSLLGMQLGKTTEEL